MSESNPIAESDTDRRTRYLILGTAGHIDHGKTSLVRALTGTDTDRLPEEQRRGMTIELGFAELRIGSVLLGVVDVPGHERFVRTMVAGATGIDMALIVVAGDDSVMPQTVEHVEVLRLMGIGHAVIAISKIDMVDEAMLELVEDDVRTLLSDTPLADSPMVRVSSTTGAGIDELRDRLAAVARKVPHRDTSGPFRMAVDRVFTVQGRGTVVTGSVIRGEIRSGDTLEILPGGQRCRVRDMQSHGRTEESLRLGQRAALNLIGVDRDAVKRGHEIVTPDYVSGSIRIDATLDVLSTNRTPIPPFSRVRLCMGTREWPIRVVPISNNPIEPGGSEFVQLRADEPMYATFGQRFIVRQENGTRTVGGGMVLRPSAVRWSRKRDAERAALGVLAKGPERERLVQVLTECGFRELTPLRLSARTGIHPDGVETLLGELAARGQWVPIDGTDRKVAPAVVDALFDRADRWLERYHGTHPDEPGCHVDALTGWLERKSAAGLGRKLIELYLQSKRAKIRGRFVCLAAFAPAMSARDERLYKSMLEAFATAAFQPPALEKLSERLDTDTKRLRRLVKLAVAAGELVEIDGAVLLSGENEARLRSVLADLIETDGGATVARVREKLDSSRKFVVPMLEYLDRVRFTAREGDLRVLCKAPTQ